MTIGDIASRGLAPLDDVNTEFVLRFNTGQGIIRKFDGTDNYFGFVEDVDNIDFVNGFTPFFDFASITWSMKEFILPSEITQVDSVVSIGDVGLAGIMLVEIGAVLTDVDCEWLFYALKDVQQQIDAIESGAGFILKEFEGNTGQIIKSHLQLGTSEDEFGNNKGFGIGVISPSDGVAHNAVKLGIYTDGTDEYEQFEIGNSKHHLNLNSGDRPTIEMGSRREEIVTTPNANVTTINYVEDITLPMENGEMRFVSDPNIDIEPEISKTSMLLIDSPETNKVLTANNQGQAVESDLDVDNISLRSDGFLLRLSRTFNTTIASGAIYNMLSTYNLANDVLLYANTQISDWQLISGALIFPALDGYTNYTIDVRLYGTIGGGGGTVTEFSVQLTRQTAGTVAAERGVIKVDSNLAAKAVTFESYTLDLTDPFIDGGVRIEINNTSGSSISLTRADVVIKGTKH